LVTVPSTLSIYLSLVVIFESMRIVYAEPIARQQKVSLYKDLLNITFIDIVSNL
jgi:hypothetical protein